MQIKHITLAALIALTGVAANAAVGGSATALAGSFITLSDANVTGGALVTDTVPYVRVAPADAVGEYLAVGPNDGAGDSGTVSFAAGTQVIGFEWGTPDLYNTLLVTETNGTTTTTTSFSYTDLGLTDQVAAYVSFYADAGYTISSATFESTQNAFEAANFTAAVPEPANVALMLAGLGMFGFMARKRRM